MISICVESSSDTPTGGSNSALRTLYYRLVRLLSLGIQPLFIFDGPKKPPVKRGKRTGAATTRAADVDTKKMLQCFGFPFCSAPGEAEAECALLQRVGIVDAVLSEDVDTIMFGCGLTLRNWSSLESRGNQPRTHVNAYDSTAIKRGPSGLDREGLVLVAMLSGGDYTEGISGCGPIIASEAARAGFGKTLCSLGQADPAAIKAWRDELAHELRTNHSKFFKTRHGKIKLPEEFPQMTTLGYYTHPFVSSSANVARLKESIVWMGVDVPALREFVKDKFEWKGISGAHCFIRSLAPALLVSKMLQRANLPASDDLIVTEFEETELVRKISKKRNHSSMDGLSELQLEYCPQDIICLALDEEEEEEEEEEACRDYGRDGLAPIGNDGVAKEYESDSVPDLMSLCQTSTKQKYDPTQLHKVWIPETIAKLGIPLKVEDYEELQRNLKKPTKRRTVDKASSTKGGMRRGALDKYVVTMKPSSTLLSNLVQSIPSSTLSNKCKLPPVYLAPALEMVSTIKPRNTSEAVVPGSLKNNYRKKNRDQAVPQSEVSIKPHGRTIKENIVRSSHRKMANPWETIKNPSNSSRQKDLAVTVTKFQAGRTGSSSKSSSTPPSQREGGKEQYLSQTPPESSFKIPRQHSSPEPPSPLSQQQKRFPYLLQQSLQPRSGNIDLEIPRSTEVYSCLSPKHIRRISNSSEQRSLLNLLPSNSSLPSLEKPFTPTRTFPQELLKQTSPHKRHDKKSRVVIELFTSPAVSSESPQPATPKAPNMDDGMEEMRFQSVHGTGRLKRYLMPRQSVDGTWIEVDEDEMIARRDRKGGNVRGRVWRKSQVEVLDLTGE
jgi:Holliday junction resolvase YEN1